MNPYTGDLYPSREAALAAGVTNPVVLEGQPEAVAVIAEAVRNQHSTNRKARRRIARMSRRVNR